jgi:hypothetical protein
MVRIGPSGDNAQLAQLIRPALTDPETVDRRVLLMAANVLDAAKVDDPQRFSLAR